ncbi:MAG TPA: SPOR domain-containing protein [Steroidobacteraceae bacterium]
MRAPIIILVFANLAFAAWALLVDRPVNSPAARDISHLTRLVLASEPAPGTPANAGRTGPPGQAGGTAATNPHCVTVGPFGDLAIAAAAASLLQSRGFTPTQRDEPGQDLVAYWVYLDNVPSETEANRLLQKLRASGLTDARVMPVTTAQEARRVSVGLFYEKAGAERRARQVKSLGLTPMLTEQHQSQATYWVDINLTSPGQSVSTEGLLPSAAAGAHLEIRDCPVPGGAPAASSGPVAQSSASVPGKPPAAGNSGNHLPAVAPQK